MGTEKELATAFAPGGTLRVAINLGNPVLAWRRDGELAGLQVELAREIAGRFGLEAELLAIEGAASCVATLRSGDADLGFFAVDPARSEGLRFTKPYAEIEGAYVVRKGSPISAISEVDRKGLRIMVGKGSAYDLYLTRNIVDAEIVRCAGTKEVIPAFLDSGCEVAAGLRQGLEAELAGRGDLRILPGRFMVIEQAIAVPADRPLEVGEALDGFVADIKASGWLRRSMEGLGMKGVGIAP